MIEQLQLILKALPWTAPAVLGGLVLALLTMVLFPTRRSRADRFGFALFTWCLVVAAVVTLSPVRNDYFGVPTTGCDWSIWQPLAREYWFSSGSRPPNVWLLFPAGVGVMLLDGVWRKLLGIIVLFALPPGIETLQDLYPELKRSCSSQDVVDNWTGLVLGLVVGAVLAILVAIARSLSRAARRRRERRDGVLRSPASPGAHPAPTSESRGEEDSRPLPLGGRADERYYDDFSDFDDTPSSSRWYERPREWAVGGSGASAAGAQASGDMPRREPLVDPTPPYGTPLHSSDAPTQAVHERARATGSTPERRADDGDDDTQILPRR